MKRSIEGEDRSRSKLFPEHLDDYIAEDNPVRVIDVFVDERDLKELGFDGMQPEVTGRPGCHPGSLLKIYIWSPYVRPLRIPRRSVFRLAGPFVPRRFAVLLRCGPADTSCIGVRHSVAHPCTRPATARQAREPASPHGISGALASVAASMRQCQN